MMRLFISIKKHNHIIEHKNQTINDYYAKIVKLEKELEQAKNLENILKKFDHNISSLTNNNYFTPISGGYELNLPDTVLQYTEDILGGKVIKQEGTKCIVIDKNGDVEIGLTKQKADKGYNYKLQRN